METVAPQHKRSASAFQHRPYLSYDRDGGVTRMEGFEARWLIISLFLCVGLGRAAHVPMPAGECG